MSTNTLKQALEIVYGDIKNINKRVVNLESASAGVLYTETTKSAVAYQDNVSANACPYALLNIVGAMSYKSENLLNIPNVAETTTNGITYSVSNGVITLNGTASANAVINIRQDLSLDGNYVLAIFNSTPLNLNNVRLYHSNNSANVIVASAVNATTSNSYKAFTTTNSGVGLGISISANSTLTNAVIKPMLVKGSTAPTEYQPYFEGIRDTAITSVISKDSNNTALQTISIPNEIQALEGYGWGINDTCYNYIDLNTKKFISKVVKYTFTGNETISLLGGHNNIFYFELPTVSKERTVNALTTANDLILYTAFDEMLNDNTSNSYICGATKGTRLLFKLINIANTASALAYLTGKTFYYELATPIETDISSYLDDNSIQIEANGTITFDNTYQQAIPYEYLYLEKVGANNE